MSLLAEPTRTLAVPAPRPAPPQATTWFTPRRIGTLIAAFLVIGLLARLARFLLRFPLWEDEAFLAYNLMNRSYAELLQPLDYIQVAPLGYLWLQRAVIDLVGFTEYTLRFTALVAGLASLFLFRRVASLTLPSFAQLFANAVFAVSYPMIRYSAEAKPYGLDLFLGLTLVWLFLEWQRAPAKTRWLAALCVVAALGPFLSHPLVFVGGGVSLAWAWMAWAWMSLGAWRRTLLAAFPWLLFNALLVAAFGAHVVLAQQAMGPANRELMQEFWGSNFPPIGEPLRLLWWLWSTHTGDFLAFPVGGGNGGSTCTFLAIALGLAVWLRQARVLLLVLTLTPISLHFTAAALHRFPYGGHVKFTMYWAALAVLVVASGLAAGVAWLDRRRLDRPLASRLVLIGLAVIVTGSLARDFLRPAKTMSDQHARDFARWFWADMAHDNVLVCLHTDLHRDFTANLTKQLNWSASYFCNLRIYSPRLAAGQPPEWERVSKTHPLRCLEFRPNNMSYDAAARDAWLRDMEKAYELKGTDSYPVPRYSQNGRWLLGVDYIDAYVFVPRRTS